MEDAIANLVIGVVATFVPLVIGLFIPVVIRNRVKGASKGLMAFAAGAMFWSFLDVMNDAVLLDVNQGFNGGAGQALLAGLFAVGLLFLFGLERIYRPSLSRHSKKARENSLTTSFVVAVLVALGIGFHALGEGVEIGSLIRSGSGILEAIGGLRPGIAYALHKLLEGFVIGTFAALTRPKPTRILYLALVAGLPTLLGMLLATGMPLNSTFFFALGGAGVVYTECKLLPNLADGGKMMAYVVVMLLGFYSMYLAGLLHG